MSAIFKHFFFYFLFFFMFSLAVTVMLAVHGYRNGEEKTADSPTVRIYSPLLEKGKKKTVYLTSGFKLPECLSGRRSSCSSDADMQLAPVKL